MNETKSQRETLNLTTKLAFGAGDMGPAITANVLVFFLLPFFTNVAGIPAGLAGMILLIGKIADAINDPIVGVMSDRTTTRWGRRLPWMLWGAIPFGFLFLLQWVVPRFSENETINDWGLFGYYVAIAILFNIAYTAVNLPYTALTPELTQDYNERTSLNSFRFAFSIGGSLLSLILAGVIFSAFPEDGIQQYWVLGIITTVLAVIPIFWCALVIQERGQQPILSQSRKKKVGGVVTGVAGACILYGISQAFTGSMLRTVVCLLLGVLTLAFGLTLLFYRPESSLSDAKATVERERTNTEASIPLLQQFRIAFSNKPFLYVIGIYLCSWLGVQLTASILLYYVVSWMGLSDAAFTTVALAVQGTALVMLFFWQWVSKKVGKKAVYYLGTVIWIIAQAGLFLLQPGQTFLMYVLAVLAGFGVSVAYLVPWSMIPDVVDLDELNTGQRREGIFYGFMVLLQKFGLAASLFLVGLALEWAGFIETVPGEPIPVQPESALLAIRIAIGPLPTVILILGLILAYFYPISQTVHQEILLKLEERKKVNQ
jgi:GPH family glycoside/pentoside/hexuronide:cation symporter